MNTDVLPLTKNVGFPNTSTAVATPPGLGGGDERPASKKSPPDDWSESSELLPSFGGSSSSSASSSPTMYVAVGHCGRLVAVISPNCVKDHFRSIRILILFLNFFDKMAAGGHFGLDDNVSYRDIWMNNACVKFEERRLNPSKVIALTTKLWRGGGRRWRRGGGGCVADENIIYLYSRKLTFLGNIIMYVSSFKDGIVDSLRMVSTGENFIKPYSDDHRLAVLLTQSF